MSLKNKLAENATKLQVASKEAKVVSFGRTNQTENFIDESAKALSLGWNLKNETDQAVFIAFMPISGSHNLTMFANIDEVKAATGADCIFGEGQIFTKSVGGANKYVTVTSLDSRRDISQFVKYGASTPLRFTKFSMDSKKIDGSKDDTNFNNRMKSFWFTPLEDTVPVDLDLRPLRQGGNNFNTDMMDVDFITQGGGFKAVYSNEHAFVMQLNAGTELTITAFIGAQLSQAQQFYRIISAADSVMAPVRRAIG